MREEASGNSGAFFFARDLIVLRAGTDRTFLGWVDMPDSSLASEGGRRAPSRRNRLLASMEATDRDRLEPHLETVSLTAGAVLMDAGAPAEHVWFPEDGVVSLAVVMREGGQAETASIGREGLVGYVATLCSRQEMVRSVVQVPGSAVRIPFDVFLDVWNSSKTFRDHVLCYTEALFAQLVQSAACNALHKIEARFCRWLLTARERAGSDSVALTQDALAEMLGVQRSTINLVARTIQERGLIRYRRGNITILDAAGLEATSCECYRAVRAQYERLIPAARGL